MVSRSELSTELMERLKDLFVNDFDKVNNAKENINVYLESIEIENKYSYNDFCADFLKVSERLIESLSPQDIESLDAMFIMGEIMSVMVKYKIIESEKDESLRLQKIIQHELRTKNIKGYNNSS